MKKNNNNDRANLRTIKYLIVAVIVCVWFLCATAWQVGNDRLDSGINSSFIEQLYPE